jgi:hypothetical protein
VRFAAITLCVASQRVFIVVVYFVIDSVRKLLDTPSYETFEMKSVVLTEKRVTSAVGQNEFGRSRNSPY